MINAKQFICLMGCVSLVPGCAWYPGKDKQDKQAFSVRPVMQMKHGNAGPDAMYRLGRYHQGKANYTEAISAYEKALAMNPGHVEAYNGLAVSYSLYGQHELALQYLRQALQRSPKAAHLHNNLGYVQMTLGQIGEAAAAFEQALRLDPENRWARGNVAVFYEKMGLNDAAMLTALLESTPARAGVPLATRTQAMGASSDTMPAAVAVATFKKQETQHNTHNAGVPLVQIAPNVFEFRMSKNDPPMAIPAGGSISGISASQEARIPDSEDIRIEVSNGSGAAGMARQVSDFLQEHGLPKARLTDSQPFRQIQTEIHYRPGNYVLARQISQMMPKQIPMMESYNLRRDIQVRILLGKDAAGEVAYLNIRRKIQVAQSLGKAAVIR